MNEHAKQTSSSNFLFNDSGRPRSGWRFLIFQFLFIVFGGAFGTSLSFLLAQMSIVYERGSVLSFVVSIFTWPRNLLAI